ncbi:hypothetical protein ACHAQD_009471 [Fusarium lateritium]
MTSAREAEQIIRELTGGYKLGAQIHDSADQLLLNLLLLVDNKSFTTAASNNSVPSIVFEIHPKHIIVDCNDDGLTRSDLESICKATTEKETTTTAAIFKSIVAAAEKVHIQSGNFSLDFRHNLLDPKQAGLKPVWAPASKELPNIMTVYLHDHGDYSDVSRLRQSVTSQFMNLDGTCLLFLRALEQVTVRWYVEHPTSDRHYTKRFCKKAIGPSRVSLERFSGLKVEKSIERLYFHIQRNLDVTLAFPLRLDGTSLISGGKIFNILPIRTSMYNFHIHGRFELDEKQQTINPESSLNLLYRVQVENAFIQAIETFCTDPVLRYHWPLFLPLQPGEATKFWKGLDANIYTWIQRNPILQSRSLKQCRLIHHVVTLSVNGEDHDRKPIFNDPTTDPFLSEKYPKLAIDRMKGYGLKGMTYRYFVDLLVLDLNSDNSKMRQGTPSDAWHEAVAGALCRVPQDTPCFRRLKALPLLPLRDGTWATIESGPVVFPFTGNADIPETLNLRFISSSASRMLKQHTLFERLGVTKATVPEVTKLILERLGVSKNLSLPEVKGCLHFLYLSRQTSDCSNASQSKGVKVLTADMKLVNAHNEVAYLPGKDNPHSPESLLAPQKDSRGLRISFLHPDILAGAPGEHIPLSSDWKAWLCGFCGIREQISLCSPMFFESCGILVPHEVTPTWTDLSSCVWDGPPGTITVHSLKRLYLSKITNSENRKKIEKLLHVSLGIHNTTVDNLTSELKELRRVRCEDPRRILGIFQYWNAELNVNHETRALFEESPLILAKKEGSMGWYKIYDCVWPSNASLGGKAVLSDLYGGLKEFFVDKLGVEGSMLNIRYDELKESSQRSVKATKAIIMQFSDFLRTTTVLLDPEPIRKSKIFPVKGPEGTVSLCSIDADFAIRDTLFDGDWLGHLAVLDFDLKETRHLKLFFSWLGIEDRYLSRCIEEQTSIPNIVGSPISSGPRYFKRKFYHILRVAAAFDSPRFSKNGPSLRKQLRNMEIVEIDGIMTVKSITQNGKVFQTSPQEAYLHFVEGPEKLIIYVPKKEKDREICFRTFLPRELAGWLMHTEGQKKGNVDFEMVNALNSLLASDEASLDGILHSLSIPSITDTPPDGTLDEADNYSDEEELDTERGDGKEDDESDEGFETCDDLFEDGPVIQGSPETYQASPEVIPSTFKAPVETEPSQSEVNLALRPSNAACQAHTDDGGDTSGLSQLVNLSEQDSFPTPQVAAN